MAKDWAEGIAAGYEATNYEATNYEATNYEATNYEATKLLRGAYQVEHVHVEEALPDNFVVVVYLAGYPEPCVLGDQEGTQAWLDARGLKCDEAEVLGADADRVAECLLGPVRRTYTSEERHL